MDTPLTVDRPTVEEMTNSLNGFDFIAIKSRYGRSVDQMDDDPITVLYALIYISKRREGLGENEAYQEAMSVPLVDAQEFFAPEPDDVDPDDPDTEVGKDS